MAPERPQGWRVLAPVQDRLGWRPSKYGVDGRGQLRPGPDTTDQVRSWIITDAIAAFYRSVEHRSFGALVDLGCGNAPLYGWYRSSCTAIVWADWPQTPHTAVPPDVQVDLSRGLPFRSGSFDTVLLSDVLEHVADSRALVQEAMRVLRPGGTLLGNVPFAYPLHEEPWDYWRFTEHGLRHLFESVGFASCDIRALGGPADSVADTVVKLLCGGPSIGRLIARNVARFWCAVPARVRGAAGRRFPIAYGFVVRRP